MFVTPEPSVNPLLLQEIRESDLQFRTLVVELDATGPRSQLAHFAMSMLVRLQDRADLLKLAEAVDDGEKQK